MEMDHSAVRGIHRVDQVLENPSIGSPRRVAPSWILVSHDTSLKAGDLSEQCIRNAQLHHVRNMVVELEGPDAISRELLEQLLHLRSSLESKGGRLRVVNRRSLEASCVDELDASLPIYGSLEAAFAPRRHRSSLASQT